MRTETAAPSKIGKALAALLLTTALLQSEPPLRSARIGYWSQREISAGPGRVRQSGPTRS